MKFKEILRSTDFEKLRSPDFRDYDTQETHTFEGHDEEGNRVKVSHSQYPWGKFINVECGHAESFPLHPEHQEQIRKLNDGDHTIFKDETNSKIVATRNGDKIHLRDLHSSSGVSVSRHHFTE